MTATNSAVGIFDSGFGGLTVVRAFEEFLPEADLIFFGDTARVPYGTRDNDELRIFAKQNVSLLCNHGAAGVIAACGTVSSLLTPEEFSAAPVPFSGVITAAAELAARSTKSGRIGILGTSATVRNQGFKKDALRIRPDAQMFYVACPDFVPLAERGIFDPENAELQAAIQKYVVPLMENDLDVIILGCTHYPLLADAIRTVSGDTMLIDAGREAVRRFCSEHPVTGTGKRSYYVSGNPESFQTVAAKLLGHSIDLPQQDNADRYLIHE